MSCYKSLALVLKVITWKKGLASSNNRVTSNELKYFGLWKKRKVFETFLKTNSGPQKTKAKNLDDSSE
jgi:hypothetical protein